MHSTLTNAAQNGITAVHDLENIFWLMDPISQPIFLKSPHTLAHISRFFPINTIIVGQTFLFYICPSEFCLR